MGAIRFLFDFDGRLARGRLWLVGLAIYAFATMAVATDPVLRTAAQSFIVVPGIEVLILYLLLGMMSFAAMVLAVGFNALLLDAAGGQLSLPMLTLELVLAAALAWIVTAVGTRRLHDRDKGGGWLILFFLAPLLFGMAGMAAKNPMVGWLMVAAAFVLHAWSFLELGLRRGTRGANHFGPDPRG